MAVVRTAITENPGVIPVAKSQGQSLRYIVRASGPIPLFRQSDENGYIKHLPNLEGVPRHLFTWEDSPLLAAPELVNTGFSFFTNPTYTYSVELLNAAGEPIWTMFEIQFSGDATDTVEESFRVLTQ